MYSPELLRVEAAECRRGAMGKSARVERTLLALAERLESQATVLEARESAGLPRRQEKMRNLPSPILTSNIGKTRPAAISDRRDRPIALPTTSSLRQVPRHR
jgi:hypothetical protein